MPRHKGPPASLHAQSTAAEGQRVDTEPTLFVLFLCIPHFSAEKSRKSEENRIKFNGN